MKRAAVYCTLVVMLSIVVGCSKPVNDSDAIRSGINEHLNSLKTLNLSAMDMSIQNVSIQGDQAQAQVEFRPKAGAPQGAGMQVSYKLEKHDGKWMVQNTQPAGGAIEHPAPGQNPHQNAAAPASTALPDFRNLVNSGSPGQLPPGHPPINTQAGTPPQ
jgi:hypothetical protein